MAKGTLPAGFINTASVTFSRQITGASVLKILSIHSALSHCRTRSLSVITTCAPWQDDSSSVQQWVCTLFVHSARMDNFTRRDDTHNEMRDTKDIWSRLLRASSHYPLLAYCQSDHKQLGVTWAGNKLLINNYLNGGKHTDETCSAYIFSHSTSVTIQNILQMYRCCIYIKVYVSTVSDVTCYLFKYTIF